ncbi:MAG TPA: maleylacetate reductase [Burkholderiales bacterium]|nr:maleylacetate reductase [Burkholderiales bacterium]
MKGFVYTAYAARVVFGEGAIAQLPAELERLGAQRALVLSTPEQAASVRAVAARLGSRAAGVYDRAAMHVPLEIAEDARRVARELGADCCVTVGGGSTTGLGKAIALVSSLPIIAVPTTYAGSEMTPIYGLTEAGMKRTGRDARVLPKTVIYDPALTLTLPPALSAASGMNAIAHCVEALYAHDGNPIVSLMAEEGIRALAAALPVIVGDPSDMKARSEALYGAWLAGVSLGTAGMALHHKLCHTLGGSFNLPHAETHAIVLPHAARYNRDAAPAAMARVARALGAPDAPCGLYDLEAKLGLSMRLSEIGMREADLERAAKIASESPYPNPRPVEYQGVLALLRGAYEGRRPEA